MTSDRIGVVALLVLALVVVPAGQAATQESRGDADTASHCDVSGSVLVPQASKATTVTHFGIGALNGVLNYRIDCVHPDATFRLTYNGRPLGAICAGQASSTLDARAAVVDFDIVFWPSGSGVVRPIREFRNCGDETGRVPFAADYADVVLIGGVPAASFSYSET